MEILKNVSLEKYNTFKLPCVAKYFVCINDTDEISVLMDTDEFENNKKYFLWNGANTIFEWDFDWLVVKIDIKWKQIISDDGDEILVKVWAWEIWDDFVNRCVWNNFVGMENLAYIPSSVWATAVQNIWAYWSEAKDIIHQVEWINLTTWELQTLDNKECNFAYRDSIFKHALRDNFVITHVIYRLKKYEKWYNFNCEYAWISEKIGWLGLNISDISPKNFVDIITEIRQSKLPDRNEIWTAWSFFKNPVVWDDKRVILSKQYPELKWFGVKWWVKLSAWQLIDMCGFKWKDNGKVWTYETHALILVNKWWAKWQDVVSFSNEIQQSVKWKFGVDLEPEAIFVR